MSLSRFPYVEIVVLVYMPYYNLFEPSRYLWRSGRNSRQHELILKSVGMSWKVASSMQIDSCGWPQLVKWLATIWLLPHERFLFIFLSSFWSLPCSCSVLRVILKALDWLSPLDAYFTVYWVPLSVRFVWTAIITRLHLEEPDVSSAICSTLVE